MEILPLPLPPPWGGGIPLSFSEAECVLVNNATLSFVYLGGPTLIIEESGGRAGFIH